MPDPRANEASRHASLPAFTSVLPRLLVVIFTVEALIMVALSRLPDLPGPLKTVLDASALSLFSAPLLWGWIVRPLRRRIEAQLAAARAMSDSIASSERDLQHQFRELRALHRLSEALAHGAGTGAICREAVAGAREAMHADRAAVLLLTGHGTLRFRAWEGLSEAYREAILGEAAWDGAISQAEYTQIPDVADASFSGRVRELLQAEGIRAISVYPVRHENRLLGFLTMHWNEPRTAQAEEARVGIAIARSVALVIDRTRHEFERRRFEQAVDSTDDAIVLTDTAGRILRVNPAFTRITGWSAEEVLGRTPNVLRSGQAPESFYTGMWETILGGHTWSARLVNLRKDRSEYHAWLTISPVFDDERQVTSFIGIQRDVTADVMREAELNRTAARLEQANRELTQAKEAAEAAARAKADFLATMSHEIRTPMNGVLGFTHLLSDSKLDESQREHLAIIQSSGQALLGIINDILDFSKIEAGRLELEPRPFDLGRAVRDVAELLGPQAARKSLEIAASVAPDVPAAMVGDEGRVRQVLINLVGNAVKFTERGAVRVEVSRSPDAAGGPGFVRVAVVDSGIGIARDKQGALFQSFSQVDRSTTRRFGGTGLGLAICRRLVGMMGGEIGVESEPGRGSTFWFTLPAPAGRVQLPVHGTAADTWQPALALQRPGRQPVRVLVADDNSVNQKLARHLLEKVGCRVDVAGNGLEALDLVGRIGYDLVLMDCHMPEMNGLEATRAIRASEQGGRLPIVALTASAMVEDREEALASGMDDFLSKPLVPDTLYRCLDRWAA